MRTSLLLTALLLAGCGQNSPTRECVIGAIYLSGPCFEWIQDMKYEARMEGYNEGRVSGLREGRILGTCEQLNPSANWKDNYCQVVINPKGYNHAAFAPQPTEDLDLGDVNSTGFIFITSSGHKITLGNGRDNFIAYGKNTIFEVKGKQQ